MGRPDWETAAPADTSVGISAYRIFVKSRMMSSTSVPIDHGRLPLDREELWMR
eukprot:m.92666 g.92666  ORF g.92666 m.92666 type:complete len:53 (-) comp26561_c2_seq2:89-247(-)